MQNQFIRVGNRKRRNLFSLSEREIASFKGNKKKGVGGISPIPKNSLLPLELQSEFHASAFAAKCIRTVKQESASAAEREIGFRVNFA